MTNREQATYDLIVENSKKGQMTTKKEIVENYPITKFADGYVWNDSPKSHDKCSTVWDDINTINFTKGNLIIIPHRDRYWVATSKKEVEEYLKFYFKTKCKPSLKRYWNLTRKLDSHATVDIFTSAIREAFLEEEEKQCEE